MHWPEFIHHLTLHFPIAGTMFLAAIGVWWVKTDDPRLGQLLRVAGWAIFTAATVTAASGIVAAPGWFGGEGPQMLLDHRNMGITVWCAIAIATVGFEIGVRRKIVYVQRFAALCWCAAAFGVVGAAHWGAVGVHEDEIPWGAPPPAEPDAGIGDRTP